MKSYISSTDRESIHKIFIYKLKKKWVTNGELLIYYYYEHVKISKVLFSHIIW